MIEYKYSTFWPRFWAGVVDGLIFWPLDWVYQWVFPAVSIPSRIVVFVVYASALSLYNIWMVARFGQTLGKMVCKVVVLDVSEAPLRFHQAVLREIFNILGLAINLMVVIPRIVRGVDVSADLKLTPVDWALAFLGLGLFGVELITMLTNDKRRALHDFIAGTVVVRKDELVALQARDVSAS